MIKRDLFETKLYERKQSQSRVFETLVEKKHDEVSNHKSNKLMKLHIKNYKLSL